MNHNIKITNENITIAFDDEGVPIFPINELNNYDNIAIIKTNKIKHKVFKCQESIKKNLCTITNKPCSNLNFILSEIIKTNNSKFDFVVLYFSKTLCMDRLNKIIEISEENVSEEEFMDLEINALTQPE